VAMDMHASPQRKTQSLHRAVIAAMGKRRAAAASEGLVLDSDDELLALFRAHITTNLHVVLTMTPPRGDMAQRAAASPALLNRCTLVYCWT